MRIAADCLIVLIALLHLYFLALEMFLWEKPIGLRVFANTPESARLSAVLAANQGLYNGFLAAGLLVSFVFESDATRASFRFFFLGCVIVAGIYGGWSVSRRIFMIQALPALLALLLISLS